MKQTLMWFNLQRDGTGNGLSNIKGHFCRKFLATNVCSAPKYVHLQGWSDSEVHMMAGQNIKKKYLISHIPFKILRQHAIPSSSLHNLNIYLSRCAENLFKYVIVYVPSKDSNSRYSNFSAKISIPTMAFCFDW